MSVFNDRECQFSVIAHTVDSEEAEAALLPVRIADIGAARGLLARLDADPGSPMHKALDLGKVALAGHSFGGAVAAEAMRLNQGVRAGINLDGAMYGRVAHTGLDRPFLQFGSEGHLEQDPTWTSFRTALATHDDPGDRRRRPHELHRRPRPLRLQVTGRTLGDLGDRPHRSATLHENRDGIRTGIPRPPPPQQADAAPRRTIPPVPRSPLPPRGVDRWRLKPRAHAKNMPPSE